MALRRTLARWLPWLMPVAMILLIVALGHQIDSLAPAPVPPNIEVPSAGEVPDEQMLELQLLDADGAPAIGARVVLLEPSLASALSDESGKVTLPYLGSGTFVFWARLESHGLLQGEFEGGAAVFQFPRLDPETIEPPVETPRRTRVFLLSNRGNLVEERLHLALVVADDVDEPIDVPWVALSDTEGKVFLEGTRLEPLALRIYAPLLPPDPAWLLASITLAANQGIDIPAEIEVDWARVRFLNLPNEEVLDGRRLDVEGVLPLRAVPATGRLEIRALPPGRYLFQTATRKIEIDLPPGPIELDFDKAQIRPVIQQAGRNQAPAQPK